MYLPKSSESEILLSFSSSSSSSSESIVWYMLSLSLSCKYSFVFLFLGGSLGPFAAAWKIEKIIKVLTQKSIFCPPSVYILWMVQTCTPWNSFKIYLIVFAFKLSESANHFVVIYSFQFNLIDCWLKMQYKQF